MKGAIVLATVILFVAVIIDGRLLDDLKAKNDESDSAYDQTNSELKHRRRSRQSYSYYENRRDNFSPWQEELLWRILNELEELSSYIKRPTAAPVSPPQIIYVPVPYSVPQYFNQSNPNIANRAIFTLDDCRQMLGQSSGVTNKPPTTQETTTTSTPTVKKPGRCKAAILVCCQYSGDQEKEDCFLKYGCIKTYSSGITCHPEIIKRVIDEFGETYAPIVDT